MKSNERILLFIANYKEKYFIAPSVREIAEGVELKSTSTVHGHLKRLERLGYIQSRLDTSRSIVITDSGDEYLKNIRKRAWMDE